MNSAPTKGTPTGQAPSTRSGLASASSKPKTPSGESAQRPSHSVDKQSLDKEGHIDEQFRQRNARKSVLRSEKNTPSEDFVNSASKNRPLSTTNKDKTSNTSKKSPFNERESAAGQSAKKPQDLANESKSATKSQQGSQSKPQSSSKVAGASTPSQQTRLDFQQGSAKFVRSAEKVQEKEAPRRSLGKLSAQSDILANKEMRLSGGKKMSIEPTLNVDEVEEMLGDESAKVQVTATKSRETSRKNTPHQGPRRDEVVIAEENESENEPVRQRARAEDVKEPEEEKVERKEYSVYEDWRIMEAIEDKMEREGIKQISSRALWQTLEDPLTGRRLLDGRRSSESLRDRYKRYICALDNVGKEEIKKFCMSHSIEEQKANHCVFKKVDGQKQFAGISRQLNYDPDRISRKTPYGTKSKKKSPDTKIAGRRDETKKGKLEKDFEEEDKEDIEEENEYDINLLQESELEDDIEQVTQTQTKTKLIKATGRDSGRALMISEDTETIIKGKNKPGLSMTSTNHPGQMKESKKRKAGDNEGLLEAGKREMKKVKQNTDYDDKNLTLNTIFQNRKPHKEAVAFENIMVCVDLDQGFRQFVKQEPEEEEEEEDEVAVRLKELSSQYGIGLPQVAAVFSRVSCDFDDLEEYLVSGDEKLLWTEEEDEDLLADNKKAIKYLKLLKGNDRIQKRKEYLLATL